MWPVTPVPSPRVHAPRAALRRLDIIIRQHFTALMPTSIKVCLIVWCGFSFGLLLRRRDRQLFILLMLSAVATFAFSCIRAIALTAATTAMTSRFDLFLYRTEWAIGSPSFVMGRFVMGTWLFPVLTNVYEAAPAVLLFVCLAHTWKAGNTLRVIAVYVTNCTGYLLYFLLPASGPVYAFSAFPYREPEPLLGVVSIAGPPNCMPSLHSSAALLALYLCWRWRGPRAISAVFVVLTLAATLALGEHYVIDLVVAVPFTAFVITLVDRRFQAAAGSMALVLAWISALRLAPASVASVPAAFLLACLGTVLAGIAVVAWPFTSSVLSRTRVAPTIE